MVISRTPFRVSFFGGGTDYPDWYRLHKGAVLSTSINKYCYIMCRYLPPFFDYNFRIRYTSQEYAKTVGEIKHPSVRACLKYLKFKDGVEIQHNADIPAMSGIGSSSAFTVGLLNALWALRGRMVDKMALAKAAIHVEQDVIGENVGSQDQVTASFGGLNLIEFYKKHEIKVTPITIAESRRKLLEENLVMFYTGISRFASKVAKSHIDAMPRNGRELEQMYGLVFEAVEILNNSRVTIDNFGKLLGETWRLKKGLTSRISNRLVDEIYEEGIGAGAIGGKLLGAGGGGFMLFFVRPKDKNKLRKRFSKLVEVPFRFEENGSQIIYIHSQNTVD